MHTYKEIEKEFNLPAKTAKQIVWKLQIKSKIISGVAYFTGSQVDEILNYKRPKKNSKYKRLKISIIEQYQRTGSARKTARILNLQKQAVFDTVKEWQLNDRFIIVESSLNYQRQSQYKNINKRGSKWSYSFSRDKKRYVKGGFETEEEAFDALIKLKECLKQP